MVFGSSYCRPQYGAGFGQGSVQNNVATGIGAGEAVGGPGKFYTISYLNDKQ